MSFEFDVHFETVGNCSRDDFELRPEFVLAVKRRSHPGDGGEEVVEVGLCVREQRRGGGNRAGTVRITV